MGMAGFTDLELAVIALQANGFKADAIARLLACSRDAVYKVIQGVYSKTGFHDTAGLTRWATEWGLDELPDQKALRRFRKPATGRNHVDASGTRALIQDRWYIRNG